MKSPMNYLLVNLAVADIMVGVFLAPIFILNHFFTHPEGLAGKFLCNTLTGGNISWVALVASSFSLVAISIERYFAIAHPLSAKQRLPLMKVKRIATGCWICALIFNMPLFFIREFDKEKNICKERWPENQPLLAVFYSSAWFFFTGVFPIVVMLVLYSKVIYILWFKRINREQVTQQAVLRSRKRVTKIAVIVSIVYAACMLPNLIMYLIGHASEEQEYDVSFIVSLVLTAFNSTFNPFVYSLQSQAFRRHLVKIVFCYKVRQNEVGITARDQAK
ncbi:pyroglutamylated RF-amide peptide receptor-like [Actinia tenebrosa]|uniref:Pyroglutamylated RF-amide peptide receptor-like n=1 Tax=Actinia tenebrosa TaxID=6105 RepID=A0A6P8J4H8_ACTTE|nr:pyroglutamylated RF-amide peptide receptor-like [Actinia tenebrosa]